MSVTTEQTVIVLAGDRLAYTLDELADATPFSIQTWRRAIRKPRDDGLFPAPLKAKRDSKGRAIVLTPVAQEWLAALPDY